MISRQGPWAKFYLIVALTCPSMLIAGSLSSGQANAGRAGSESGSSSSGLVGTGAIVGTSEGPFGGYDSKGRRVWINDFVYILRPGYKVIGSPTLAGAISAIKEGEIVRFTTKPNPDQPTIPHITEIRRQ